MNPTKYFYNRFSYAVKNNGTIKVNQQDIEAINKLIEEDGKRNTDLEDALILYFLFWRYSIENENNKLKLKEIPLDKIRFPLGISTPYNILNELSKVLDPKPVVVKKIVDEIWVYQEYERVYINKELRERELEENKFKEDENGIKTYYVSKQDMIPIDKKVIYEEVSELLEKALKKAKNDFPKINALYNGQEWKS